MKQLYPFLLAAFFILQAQANVAASDFNNRPKTSLLTVTPTFNPVAPICAGDFLAPLPTTSLNGITGSWSPLINNTVTTTYTFTPTAGQDATLTTLTITVNQLPPAPVLSVTQPTCTVGTATITVVSQPGLTYSFNDGPYTAVTIYSGVPAGSIGFIRAKSTAGCISASATVFINTQPETPATPTATVTYQSCSLATITITSVPGETYSFDGGPYLTTLVYSGLATGSSHIIIAKSPAGCISSVRNITIGTFITPNFPTIAPICLGSTAPVLPTTAPNGITGTWSPATVSNTVSQTYIFTPNASFSGCTATQSLTVNIFSQTNAGTDGGITVCDSDTTTISLFNLITGEQSGGTWTRVTGSGGTFNAASGTYTPAFGATSSTFFYTITGAAPCINDSSVATVTINAAPNAGFGSNMTVCDSSAASINLSSMIIGEQTGGTWIRNSGTGGTFNAAAGIFSPSPGATSSTFTYTITGTAPCVNSSSTVSVIVAPMPSAVALTGNQNTCVGLTTTFSATTSGGIWSSSNNTIATVNPVSGVVTGVSSGTATINYTVPGTIPCPNVIATRSITVNSGGILNIFCDASQATPTSVFFDWANITGFSSYNYSYSINNGPAITGNTTISNYQVFGVLPGQSVTFTITNVVGLPCVVSASATCEPPLATDNFETDSFKYYPNPVNTILNLKYFKPITNIRIFNVLGQQIFEKQHNSDTLQIDMSGFNSGIYMIKASFENSVNTFKVIKD